MTPQRVDPHQHYDLTKPTIRVEVAPMKHRSRWLKQSLLVSGWLVMALGRTSAQSGAEPAPALLFPTQGESTQTQAPTPRDLLSDTWVATDALGRSLPVRGQPPDARKDRFVGMFYFLTHGSAAYYDAPPSAPLNYNVHGDDPRVLRDNTEIIRRVGGDPLTKPEGWTDPGTYWWGEPAVGYFLADDPWVVRHNLQMLAEAGVDVIIFDVTNAPQYTRAYNVVLSTATEMRRQGTPTPQFAFITYSSSGVVANTLYDDLYAKGLYRDLWFPWQGKPLIFGDAQGSKPDSAPPTMIFLSVNTISAPFGWLDFHRFALAGSYGPKSP